MCCLIWLSCGLLHADVPPNQPSEHADLPAKSEPSPQLSTDSEETVTDSESPVTEILKAPQEESTAAPCTASDDETPTSRQEDASGAPTESAQSTADIPTPDASDDPPRPGSDSGSDDPSEPKTTVNDQPDPCLDVADHGLLVTPNSIVFEGRQRTAHLVLTNRGDIDHTYRISLPPPKMTSEGADDDGTTETGTEPGPGRDRYVEAFIRFSPRQIRVPAGGSQALRVALRRPWDLEPGDYRTQLSLQAISAPKDTASAPDESSIEGTTNMDATHEITVPIHVSVKHEK